MQAWSSFFEILCATSATLLGLLFVSVSVNAQAILGGRHKHSQRLAEQAFQNYLAVLVVCLVALYPETSTVNLGGSVLVMSLVWAGWVVARLYQTLTDAHGREKRGAALRRFSTTIVGFAMLIYSGIELLQGKDARDLTSLGLIVFLISATAVSWQLLVSVGTERYGDSA